jgi:hypothetical protein
MVYADPRSLIPVLERTASDAYLGVRSRPLWLRIGLYFRSRT